jgi:pimeloyl-ACP methyl ester carboxylesterase
MYVTLGDQRIFFDVVGTKLAIDGARMREKPTLIALHGGPGFDHTGLRPVLDDLADVAQVIYLDHRGNGRSVPSSPLDWNLAQWGDDIHAFCRELEIESPIVLGQSFGGMVAQSYATRHPDHPRAVILSSTAARMDFAASFDIFLTKGGAAAREIAERFWTLGDDASFEEYMRVCMPLYNPTAAPDGANARARSIMRREVYRHFSLPGCEIHRMDFHAALACVKCPVLVLAGREDPITPPHLATEIVNSIPRELVSLELFDGCGHGAFRDHPGVVLNAVRHFITQL